MTPLVPLLLLGGGTIAAIVLSGKGTPAPPPPDKNEPDDVPQDTHGGPVGAPAKTIAVGKPSDPKIAAWLKSMGEVFKQGGVNVAQFSPVEVTTMPKAPGHPVAIPPQQYWPRMITTIVKVAQPLRAEIGVPFSLGGYRPADYNAAVGGKPGSRHQWFEALDIRAKGKTEELKLAAARFFVEHPTWSIGLGIYSGNIHVDFGYKRRTWEDAKKYIAKVGG